MAIQKAPKKTNKIPKDETTLVPNGSAEITTPKKPMRIARTLTMLILSLKKKWDIISSIKGDVNNTGYTNERGNSRTPFKTKRKPIVWITPLIIWKV